MGNDIGAGYTVISRGQAHRSGYDDATIASLLRRGAWCRVRRGIYCRDPAANADDTALVGAVLAVTGWPVVSHDTAAWLHGLADAVPPDVHLTVPPSARSPRRYPRISVSTAALPGAHVTHLRGLPVTTVARTVVDLARRRSHLEAVALADSALHRGKVSSSALRRVVDDCAGWPGVRRAAAAAAFADGRSESGLESLARVRFADSGLPPPTPQARIVDPRDGWWARVDFLWPDERVVGEADGLCKYTDAAVLRAEKLRQERLEELGYAVVRVTWAQLTRDPAAVVARIEAARRRQARRG